MFSFFSGLTHSGLISHSLSPIRLFPLAAPHFHKACMGASSFRLLAHPSSRAGLSALSQGWVRTPSFNHWPRRDTPNSHSHPPICKGAAECVPVRTSASWPQLGPRTKTARCWKSPLQEQRERFRRVAAHDSQMFSVHWNPQTQLHQHAGPSPPGPEVCIQQVWAWGPEILVLFNK